MFLSDRMRITSKREYSDEGFLKVPAKISRTGIQEYLAIEMGVTDKDPNHIIKVYRPEEEVFSADSLKSFTNKTVTNNHPPELVSAENSRQYAVGFSGAEVVRDGMFVSTVLHVSDAEAIKMIESGKVELSNGYTSDIDWTPGISPEGETYDAVQRNIKGNHIAIVERGRAGSACRVADTLPTKGDEAIMAKITIDGVDFEVSEQAAQAVGKLQVELSDAEKEMLKKEKEVEDKDEEMEEKAKDAKKTEDSLKAQLDAAKEQVPSAETLDKMVADRKAVVDGILKVMPDIKWEGKDTATLMAEVVVAKCPNVQLDSVSADYIKARFDSLAEAVAENSQSTLNDAFTKEVVDDNQEIVDNRPLHIIARENFSKETRDAYKKGAK